MKAQLSMELMLYVAILLVIMSIALFFALTTSISVLVESVNTDAKLIAEKVALEVNTAVEVGGGYSHKFFLPEYAYGSTSYTINITQQRVYIFWNNRSYSLPVLAANVTGMPVKGNNTVRNSDGAITFA